MNRRIGPLVILALVGLALPSIGYDLETGGLSLPRCSPLPPYFCADASYFLADSSYMVEVYFSVCNEGLQFIKTDDGYKATADVSVVLRDGKGNQIAGDTYRLKLYSPKYAGTTSIDSCQTHVVAFTARPGDFKMGLGLYDRDSRAKSLLEAAIHIPSLMGYPSLSDIELLEPSSGVHEGERQGFAPNIRRIYGADRDSIRFYYEVYHGEKHDTLRVFQEILDSNGTKILEVSRISTGKGRAAHLETLPADSLSSRRYTLRIGIKTPEGKVLTSRSRDFEVRRESFYSGRDVDDGVALLTYIATSSQIDAFAKANEDERKKIWEEFWREKDPTPGTPRNEFLEEHLRRFRYANEHYAVPMTEGWKADRGRIYILYGEPDQIDSYPFEMGRKPTEVWYYLSKGRRFVFVDETGFGDYVLVGGGG